jgi:UDP-N-acetylmuramate dehydrogenase
MPTALSQLEQLAENQQITLRQNESLAKYTRFGIGGPADLLIDTPYESALVAVYQALRQDGIPVQVIGGGSNLVVADAGFRGAVVRFTGNRVEVHQNEVRAEAGAVLQDVVDLSIEAGLGGIHTMTGIPGWVGGAIFGNAGAYGRSIDQSVLSVRFFDGMTVRIFNAAQCRFRYRESTFKEHRGWVIFSTVLQLTPADSSALRERALEIRAIRDVKYPPTMKCAGSIFKNLIFAELPPGAQIRTPRELIQGGKVPAAWFLEQVGAKGMTRGGIHVATYHANLIYNANGGTAQQVWEIAQELKARVRSEFGIELEEEVQYVGFEGLDKP